MGNPIWNLIAGPIFESFNKLIDHFFPDANQAAAAKLKVLELQQESTLAFLNADTQLALAQATTNTAEASSGNWFASSWRPLIGYVCALGLFYNFLGYPVLTWALALAQSTIKPPALISGDLMTLVIGMLGLGAMRSFEKYKGVD